MMVSKGLMDCVLSHPSPRRAVGRVARRERTRTTGRVGALSKGRVVLIDPHPDAHFIRADPPHALRGRDKRAHTTGLTPGNACTRSRNLAPRISKFRY